MSLRMKSFLRMAVLLSLLVAISCAMVSAFLIRNHRENTKDIYGREASFFANHSRRLILWDDRVALGALLAKEVEEHPAVAYTFIERAGQPYIHTFQRGVPKALLQLPGEQKDRVTTTTLRNSQGEVFYDIAAVIEEDEFIIHIGLSRNEVDREMLGGLVTIGLFGIAMVLIGVLFAAGVAAVTVREVN